MSLTYEDIQYNLDIPIKIFIHNLNYTQNHWHNALEILFVLDGSISIGIDNAVYIMQKEDVIIINSNEIHTTSAKDANLVMVLQISNDWINKYPSFKNTHLTCNSFINKNQMELNQIRKLMAQMMWACNNQSLGFELRLQSYAFELLYKLLTNFQTDKITQVYGVSEKYMQRLSNIVHYLNENYDKNLSLHALADKEYLSTSYISRFFKKHIGISLTEYISRMRLEHAVKDLLYSDKSITQLSLDNGFPNSKSFINVFKTTYNETPSLYRKRAKEDYQFLYGPKHESNNYFMTINFDMFSCLYKYINLNLNEDIHNPSNSSIKTISYEVNLNEESVPLLHTWRNLICVGKAKDVLKAEVKEQLSMIQRDIGFRFLRFHGIFDDEMGVYSEDSAGNPILNFNYIDKMIDFLYQIGMKPFIELSFMPSQLAKKINIIFYRPSIISMPKDMKKWCFLVQSFIIHCMERYGKEEVEKWYFEFWNEPEYAGLFWNDSDAEYLSFYAHTYNVIKSISASIHIGGPAVFISSSDITEWLNRYLSFCATEKCLPDFFTFHYYPCPDHNVSNSTLSGYHRIKLSIDSDFLRNSIQKMAKFVSVFGYDHSQIYITEWNSNSSHRDLSRDTLYMASYIVKNVLENMDSVSSFGYWTISDFIEELPPSPIYFHGGLGVITVNGIKKAGYYAFKLLSLLGKNRISSGPGFYITSNYRGYQIILYNYCHFDSLYCCMDQSSISHTNRYDIFKDNFNKTIQITLTGFKESNYEIKEYTVSRTHGSAFDVWVEIGAPENLDFDEVQYLNSKSVPLYQKSYEVIKDTYIIQRCLSPHEIRLIEINQLSY